MDSWITQILVFRIIILFNNEWKSKIESLNMEFDNVKMWDLQLEEMRVFYWILSKPTLVREKKCPLKL